MPQKKNLKKDNSIWWLKN